MVQGFLRSSRAARRAWNVKCQPLALPLQGRALVNFLNWNSDFLRSLEDNLHSLSSQAQHDHHHVAKQVDDLLEDSKKLLMLPFSTHWSASFPRLVRDLYAGTRTWKPIWSSAAVRSKIDKRVLEELRRDALIHKLTVPMHGVETPAARSEQLNKPPHATITIAASPVNGNKVEILVSDDARAASI